MKRIKAFGIVFLLIAILTVAIILPPTAWRINDDMLLRKVKTQLLNENSSIDEVSMSVVDKIALISNYKKSGHNVVIVSQGKQTGSNMTEKDLPSIALSELEKLKKIGVFPEINLNNEFKCNYDFAAYTDIDEPTKNVRVWNVDFTSDKSTVHLMMDADTHLIYQIFIGSSEGFLPALDSGSIPQKFAEYIGVKWESKSIYQLGSEQYSAANGEIFYTFSQQKEDNGLIWMSIHISTTN